MIGQPIAERFVVRGENPSFVFDTVRDCNVASYDVEHSAKTRAYILNRYAVEVQRRAA